MDERRLFVKICVNASHSLHFLQPCEVQARWYQAFREMAWRWGFVLATMLTDGHTVYYADSEDVARSMAEANALEADLYLGVRFSATEKPEKQGLYLYYCREEGEKLAHRIFENLQESAVPILAVEKNTDAIAQCIKAPSVELDIRWDGEKIGELEDKLLEMMKKVVMGVGGEW